jgi:hypothetical protein
MAADPTEENEGGAPPSVEDFITGKGGGRRRAPVDDVKPNPNPEIASRDKFLMAVQDTSKPEPFTVHDQTVLCRGLSAKERSISRDMATTEGNLDGFVLECAYVHFGMVEPHFEMAELALMTEGWLDPIYAEILRRTQMRDVATRIGADGPAPLDRTNGFARFLPTGTGGAEM